LIPRAYLQEWSASAPWPDLRQVEPAGVRFSEDDAIDAFGKVWKELVVRIKGDAWKLTDNAVGELREKRYPQLLK